MRFKLLIEYDGTNFSGWQKQKNAQTIQGTIIGAIEEVFKEAGKENKLIDFQGSGRTDAGVHAYAQVAHLECETDLKPKTLFTRLNETLPSTISILKLEKADPRFHARHNAKSRQYIYRISTRRNVFEKRHTWLIKEKLDTEKMNNIAKLFIGMHDFISFSDKPSKEKSTKVLVDSLIVSTEGDMILIRIKASHYLWKMVRRITGVLVEAGKGKLTEDDVRKFIESHDPEAAKYTAPSAGLFLEQVYY